MADFELKADTAVQTVINKNAALADGSRAAGDYDNGTALDPYCTAYLTVQWDTTAPAEGNNVADLYVLPGDGAGTEVFPHGGDGTVGVDETPQAIFLVGRFEARDPSTSTDRVYALPNVQLHPDGNRFVILNNSGQQFDLTWQLDIKPWKTQSV